MKKISLIVFYLIIIVFISIFLSKYKLAFVLSGSMTPTIKTNDLVLIKKTKKIKIGDIVSYNDFNKYETLHRIVKIDKDMIITKGDANNKDDSPININNITGKYLIKVTNYKTIQVVLIISIIILLLLNIKKKSIIYLLLIITIIMNTNNYYISKYNLEFNSVDNINVAKWNVDIDDSNNDDILYLVAGNNSSSYKLKLINKSEMSSKYSISISNIPSGVEIKLDDNDYIRPIDNIIEFNNIGIIKSNNSKYHTLYFKASIDSEVSLHKLDININFVEEV